MMTADLSKFRRRVAVRQPTNRPIELCKSINNDITLKNYKESTSKNRRLTSTGVSFSLTTSSVNSVFSSVSSSGMGMSILIGFNVIPSPPRSYEISGGAVPPRHQQNPFFAGIVRQSTNLPRRSRTHAFPLIWIKFIISTEIQLIFW